MRTENELRDAFHHLAADAPDASEVLIGLHRTAAAPRRRGRGLRVGVTVAATAAAVVAVPLLLDRAPTDPPNPTSTTNAPAARPTGPFPFRIDPPAGWVVKGADLTSDTLRRWISGPGGVSCSLTAYDSGTFRTSELIDPRPAAPVDGRPAVSGSLRIGKPKVTPGVLAWQYSDGAWAVAQCDKIVFRSVGGDKNHQKATNALTGPQLEHANRQAAESTDFTVPQALVTPIRTGPLPGGLRVTEAAVGSGKLQGSMITMRGPGVEIRLMVTTAHPAPFIENGEVKYIPVPVNGKKGWLLPDGPQLTVHDGEFEYVIGLVSGKLTNPRAELIAIAEQVEVTDPDRTDTWFPLKLN